MTFTPFPKADTDTEAVDSTNGRPSLQSLVNQSRLLIQEETSILDRSWDLRYRRQWYLRLKIPANQTVPIILSSDVDWPKICRRCRRFMSRREVRLTACSSLAPAISGLCPTTNSLTALHNNIHGGRQILSDHIFKSKVCHFDLEQAEELKPDSDSAETA
jgi:hypothetical protein